MSLTTTSAPSELEELIRTTPIKAGRPLAWAVMIMLAAGTVWTYFTILPEVAVAIGSVVPAGQVRSVQHLEGGVVTAIYVKDGDLVEAGQSLVQVELAPNANNPEELRARLDGLVLTRTRLQAESRGEQPIWPQDIVLRQPNIALAEMQSYESRRAELDTTVAVLQHQSDQRKLEVSEYQSQLKSLLAELDLATQKFKMQEDLVKNALVTRVEYLETQRSVQQLQGQVNTIQVSIPRAQSAYDESQQKIEETRLQFRRTVQTDLGQAEVDIARTQQQLTLATRQQDRTTVASPITGIIKNIKIRSIGDVIKPGDKIMEVVPVAENLVIEAHLSPVDRGYVKEGQEATVKVTSYDFTRYGGLEGRVTRVAADADLDEKGVPYFLVVVVTAKNFLGSEQSPLPISAGMQASVDIKTGTKSVLEYLIRPVLKIRYEAFHER